MGEAREIYGLRTRMNMELVARELLEKRRKDKYLPALVKAIYTGVAVLSVLVVLALCLKRPPAPPKADYVKTLAPVQDKAAKAASDYVGRILDKAKLSTAADLEPEWAASMPPHLRKMYSSSLFNFASLKSARVGDVRADPAAPGVCVVECVGENNRRILVRIRAVENDKLGLVSVAALR